MEGARETGERAAREILADVRPRTGALRLPPRLVTRARRTASRS
jgi:hypothetical protein